MVDIERRIDYAVYCGVSFNDTNENPADFINKNLSAIETAIEENFDKTENISIEKVEVKAVGYCDKNGYDITKEKFEQEYRQGNFDNRITLNINIAGSEMVEYDRERDDNGNYFLTTEHSDRNTMNEIERVLEKAVKEFENTLQFEVFDYDSDSEKIEESVYSSDEPDWDFLRDCRNDDRDW